ncbi:MAG: FkbM family methyltransferase [Candidatus Altiarchaeota archaeon]|nr:FkbM family methyltransferase [Candidatus Altiarchaeota archaeon]
MTSKIVHSFWSAVPSTFRSSIFYLADSLQWWEAKNRAKNLMRTFVEEKQLVFDVGANVGHMADIFLSIGARVVAVEPQKTCIKKLQKKFKNNVNMTVLANGVGEKKEKQRLNICNDSHAMSSFLKEDAPYRRMGDSFTDGYDVEIITLDSLIENFGKPTFCKIDVEGFELLVLKGLSHRLDAFSFEITGSKLNAARDCVDYIVSKWDAEFNFSWATDFKLKSKAWLGPSHIIAYLEDLQKKFKTKDLWGDIYVKTIA